MAVTYALISTLNIHIYVGLRPFFLRLHGSCYKLGISAVISPEKNIVTSLAKQSSESLNHQINKCNTSATTRQVAHSA